MVLKTKLASGQNLISTYMYYKNDKNTYFKTYPMQTFQQEFSSKEMVIVYLCKVAIIKIYKKCLNTRLTT